MAGQADEMRGLIQAKQRDKQFRNPLDPLLLRLSKDYIDESDLSARLWELFKVRGQGPGRRMVRRRTHAGANAVRPACVQTMVWSVGWPSAYPCAILYLDRQP